MKIFTFGIDVAYPGAKHGDVPETWVTQAQANALVDHAMKEKNFFGASKYANRGEAEKAVIEKLYEKKTGISLSGDVPSDREERNLGAFFGCAVALMGIGFGVSNLRRGH